MIKCDFCDCSLLREGKLICPYNWCIKTPSQIKEMIKTLKERK